MLQKMEKELYLIISGTSSMMHCTFKYIVSTELKLMQHKGIAMRVNITYSSVLVDNLVPHRPQQCYYCYTQVTGQAVMQIESFRILKLIIKKSEICMAFPNQQSLQE